MPDEPKHPEQKIVVDEDWKSQVEAERDAAREQPPPQEAGAEASPGERPSAPLPPTTLTFLANSLYVQALLALGLLPNPESNKPEVTLDQAKQSIDLLEMLQEKTEGNRTPEESAELDNILYELRLAYVSVAEREER